MKKNNLFVLIATMILLMMISPVMGVNDFEVYDPDTSLCGTFSYEFIVSDYSVGADNCSIYADDIATDLIGTTTNTTAGQTSWSISWDTTSDPDVNIQPNITCFFANGTEVSWQSASNGTIIDNTAPVLSYASSNPVDNSIDQDGSWEGSFTSDTRITTAQINRVSSGLTAPYDISSSISSDYLSATYTVLEANIPSGTYNYYFSASDNATSDGNSTYCNTGSTSTRTISSTSPSPISSRTGGGALEEDEKVGRIGSFLSREDKSSSLVLGVKVIGGIIIILFLLWLTKIQPMLWILYIIAFVIALFKGWIF